MQTLSPQPRLFLENQRLERHMTEVELITYDSELLYTIQFPGACMKSPNMKITIVPF